MSINTNKLFWISCFAIIATTVCIIVFNSVGSPSDELYNNSNQESLCTSLSKNGLVTCLDASSNSEQGGHFNNKSDSKQLWYSQNSNEIADLNNFDFNSNSGWNESALIFDGIDDILNLKLNNFDFKDKFSVQLNLKLLKNISDANLISNGPIDIRIKNNKLVVHLIGDKEITLESTISLSPAAWYSINITYNNDLLNIYLNGQLNNSVEANIGNIKVSEDSMMVGGEGFSANISSLAVYNTALTESNINQNIIALNNKTLDIEKYYVSFDYTGNCQEWIVPISGEYQMELWGAQGSSNNNNGGKGAYTSGNITLNKNEKIFICVGEGGNNHQTNFNNNGTSTYSGGGASDIRLDYTGDNTNFYSLLSRIMVAAGGGASIDSVGGAGGALTGMSSLDDITGIINAKGGAQKAGGKAASKKDGFDSSLDIYTNGTNGEFAFGGTANGAGGGAGYFGGGAISNSGSAAGGSSYISGHDGTMSLVAFSLPNRLIFSNIGMAHYSGYKFDSTKMASGKDYMPSPYDTEEKITGKENNGYARITLIDSEKEITEKIPSSEGFAIPEKPELINQNITDSQATLDFTNTDNTQEQYCLYGTDSSNLNNLGVITSTRNGKQCYISGLEENTKYYWKIHNINGDKENFSDIYDFTTQYKTPKIPVLGTKEVGIYNAKVEFIVDDISKNNKCYIGTNKDMINIEGETLINGVNVTCSFDNLEQNKEYFIKIISSNGDKVISAETSVTTKYELPSKPVLIFSNKTKTTMTLEFESITNYTDLKCVYGEDSLNLNKEAEITLNGNTAICDIKDLTQGTNYYVEFIVTNGDNISKSELSTIKTDYEIPNVASYKDSVLNDSSITATFEVNNDILPEVQYTCSYGEDKTNLDKIGLVSKGLGDEYICSMWDLTEDTTYYVVFNSRNGSEYVSISPIELKTDFTKPTAPIFNQTYMYNENSIYSEYIVANNSFDFVCNIEKADGSVKFKGIPTNNNNGTVSCNYTGLLGADYIYSLEVINGPYTISSSDNTMKISDVQPNINISVDTSGVNENGWFKENIPVKVEGNSKAKNSMKGIVYCIDNKECNPLINRETIDGEEIITATEGNIYVKNTKEELSENLEIDLEGENSTICVSMVLPTSQTAKQCYGAYRLDKTAPTISSLESVTKPDTLAYCDIYGALTISDNLSQNSNLLKSSDIIPEWGNSGEYLVTYSVEDLAGNISTTKTNFIITLTDFNITCKDTGGTCEIAEGISTYNKKTGNLKLTINGDRFGYTRSSVSATNGATVSGNIVTIPGGNSGDIVIQNNWTPINYNVTYNLNGGSISGQKTSYNIETAAFTLVTPTRTGYTFTGWTGSNGATPKTSVSIAKGSTGALSYTANWQINTYFVDVNPQKDSVTYNSGISGYTFDVYINGGLVADNVQDWSGNPSYGTVIRVVSNGMTGHTLYGGDQTYTITGALNINQNWVRNTYQAHFYANGAHRLTTYNKYGDGITTPYVDNNSIGSWGYDANFHYFTGNFTAWTTWSQPDYAVGFTIEVADRTCQATFGNGTVSNAQGQAQRFSNYGYGGYCSANGGTTSCTGPSGVIRTIYDRRWEILPSSGWGYSRYADIWCNSGWSTGGGR